MDGSDDGRQDIVYTVPAKIDRCRRVRGVSTDAIHHAVFDVTMLVPARLNTSGHNRPGLNGPTAALSITFNCPAACRTHQLVHARGARPCTGTHMNEPSCTLGCPVDARLPGWTLEVEARRCSGGHRIRPLVIAAPAIISPAGATAHHTCHHLPGWCSPAITSPAPHRWSAGQGASALAYDCDMHGRGTRIRLMCHLDNGMDERCV